MDDFMNHRFHKSRLLEESLSGGIAVNYDSRLLNKLKNALTQNRKTILRQSLCDLAGINC